MKKFLIIVAVVIAIGLGLFALRIVESRGCPVRCNVAFSKPNGPVAQIITETTYYPEDGVSDRTTTTANYDRAGRICSAESAMNHSLMRSETYQYNSRAELVGITLYDGDHKRDGWISYSYDPRAKSLYKRTYDEQRQNDGAAVLKWLKSRFSHSRLCSTEVTQLNDRLQAKESAIYNREGKRSLKAINFYDSNGHVIRQEITYPTDSSRKTCTQFDGHGNTKKTAEYKNGSLVSETICENQYDRLGNVIETKCRMILEKKRKTDTSFTSVAKMKIRYYDK